MPAVTGETRGAAVTTRGWQEDNLKVHQEKLDTVIQNDSARDLTVVHKRVPVTPGLKSLCWLPV